jgi:DNA adenine methylase
MEVESMNSPLPYIGGKSKLSKTIIGRIPPHLSYCEVFAGAAWVFFRKEPFKGFHISPVSLTYTVSKGRVCTGRELLIRNY